MLVVKGRARCREQKLLDMFNVFTTSTHLAGQEVKSAVDSAAGGPASCVL